MTPHLPAKLVTWHALMVGASLATFGCSSGDSGAAPDETGVDLDAPAGSDTAHSSEGGGTDSSGTDASGTDASSDTSAADATPIGAVFDPVRITTWNPGILADDQLHLALGADGLPVRSTVCATPSPGANLNTILAGCPEGQVVQLAAGTYTISTTVTLSKGVVLRGAGSGGAARGGTTIVKTGGGSVLAIGSSQDGICYSGAFGTAHALGEDAVKETTKVVVGAAASDFAAGALAQIDELDDAAVDEGDCPYFKRVDHRSTTERVEIASVDAAAGVLTLRSPLHWTFRHDGAHAAQIAKVTLPVTRWAGIEGVLLQGGTNPGYDGQMAGGIDVSNAAYSWIKDVQTDGTIGGMHVALRGTYRVVVRDSYFHHSANYGFGQDCYGIVLACGSADDLVENDVVRYMNKPIMFNASGGGNVIGYNYADNSWATPPAWQEVNVDTHCAFPHMELMEGNYAPHMGATITHGNAGYLTYFRNYASSQFAPPAVAGSTGSQTGNITALQFDSGDVGMNVVGNVLGSAKATDLGTAPVSSVYVGTGPDKPSVFEIGDNAAHAGKGMADVAWTSLWWHGNYDTINAVVMWNPTSTVRTMPLSLYRTSKPAWWPAASAWPWAGSDLTPRVGALPAKDRAGTLP